MKTANRIPRCLSDIAAALCIAVAAGSAQAGPRVDQDVPAQVDGKLPSERVAAGQPHVRRPRPAPAGTAREFLIFEAAEGEIDPADFPVETVEVLDDATIARGRSGSVPVAQAPVYLQLDSCLIGNFTGADYTFGYGTWAAQAKFDCPPGYPLCQERGWEAGDAITGYEVRHFFCSSYSANACGVEVELWDGDPLGALDIVCNPTPGPIAGTKTTFTNLARGVRHFLKAELPVSVTYNCDRVWIVVTMIEGCRAAWTFGGTYTGSSSSCHDPPDIGWGDGYLNTWGCQQAGFCDTPSGWGAGTCCTTGEACDYTDADPRNWTGDCQEDGEWPPVCPANCWGYFTHPVFCSDGYADYYFTRYAGAPHRYYAQPGAVYAATDKYIALVPVSADAPPEQNPTPDGWRISGNEIILANPGRSVWLEIKISDWDPDHTGRWAKGWEAKIDSSGYSNTLGDSPLERPECETNEDCLELMGFGSVCEVPSDCRDLGVPCFYCNASGMTCLCTVGDSLVPYTPACATDADCEALMGSLGHPWREHAKGGCGVWTVPQGLCAAGFIDNSRSDYLLANMAESAAVDRTTLDYHYGSSGMPFESPHIGDMYMGTLVLAVPPNAKGTFTIDFDYRWSHLKVEPGIPMPMLGFIPAKITVEIGSCCYQLGGDHPPCVDSMTRRECDALAGPRVFTPGGSCADGCPEPGGCCLPDYSCEEMLPHQCAEQGGWGVDECLGDLDGNGRDDACLIEPVPTVSTWGLIILALVLTVAAKVYFARRAAAWADS